MMRMHAELRTRDALGPFGPVEEKNAPDVLYTAGDTALLTEGSRVAIVGSRKATPDGIKRAQAVTRALVQQGIIVVSGLAEGIDTVAHRTAIEEGRTIAVLGTPLSKAYPATNAGLLEEIKRDHLAISQFPEGYPGKSENFPRRTRTMALTCDATIVIEASEKSGTRHQGWEAIRLGRDLYLFENVATNPNLTWPKQLIEYGAQILRREDLPDILLDIPNYTAGGVRAFEHEYGTFANYSPRGNTELSVTSRKACGAIKAGRVNVIASAVPHLQDPKADALRPFLGPDVTLVPVPRSAPLPDGALWPAKVICDVLHEHGFGQDIQTYLKRTAGPQPY